MLLVQARTCCFRACVAFFFTGCHNIFSIKYWDCFVVPSIIPGPSLIWNQKLLWHNCNQLKSVVGQLTCYCHYCGRHWCLCGAFSMLPYWSDVSCVLFLYVAVILVTHQQILYLSVMKGTRICSWMLHQCWVSSVAFVYCNTAQYLWQLTVLYKRKHLKKMAWNKYNKSCGDPLQRVRKIIMAGHRVIDQYMVVFWYVCLSVLLWLYHLQVKYLSVVLETITTWSRVLLEKLTDPQLVEKFRTLYVTQRSVTTFTRVSHLSVTQTRSVQPMPHIPLKDSF